MHAAMAESPDTEASPVAHVDTVRYLKNAKEFSARLRSLELTVSNQTKSATLTYAGEDFKCGTWFEDISPSIIKPNGEARGFVANRQGAPTGVKGGISFSITTDTESSRFLILGFKNPLFGGYKTHISIENRNEVKIGCEKAVNDTHKFETQGKFRLEASRTTSFEGGNKNIHFVISDC